MERYKIKLFLPLIVSMDISKRLLAEKQMYPNEAYALVLEICIFTYHSALNISGGFWGLYSVVQ
jgi:hypothetical protein